MAKERNDEETPIDPMQVMDRLTRALEALSKNTGSSNEELQLKLTSALERLASTNIEGSKLIAEETRRAHRPSNEIAHGRSVFNRRGNLLPDDAEGPRKPPLKCIMLIPWLVEWESCTREEVELLNLLEPGEYVMRRTDRSQVRVTVQMDFRVDGVTPSRLIITHDTAFNNDNFKLVPDMAGYIRQLLNQHNQTVKALAAAVLTDEEEEALIEAGELTVSA